MIVDVVREERYWYPDDGGQVWLAGFVPVDADGRFLSREALAARGLLIAGVAGAAVHHADALPLLEPGSPLVLRRDAANAHDPNAVAVDVPDGGPQAGWVPRELAAQVAPDLDAGAVWSAVVLRERRDSPRDPVTGVTMLLAPAPSVKLREVRRTPW